MFFQSAKNAGQWSLGTRLYGFFQSAKNAGQWSLGTRLYGFFQSAKKAGQWSLGTRLVTNTVYLADIIHRNEYVPCCQVPVYKGLVCQVPHSSRHLSAEAKKCGWELFLGNIARAEESNINKMIKVASYKLTLVIRIID